MFDRLNPDAQRVVHLAVEQAQELRHNWIGTEHLLLALLRYEQDTGPLVGTGRLADLAAARAAVIAACPDGPQGEPYGHIPFTPRMRTIFDIIDRHTHNLTGRTIEPRHLLYGLLVEGEGVAVQVLRDLGADIDALTAQAADEPDNQREDAPIADPMLAALNAAADSLRTANHTAHDAPPPPGALYDRVGATAAVLRQFEGVLTHLSAAATSLAVSPPAGFNADDGADPAEYARQAATHLQAAHHASPGMAISDAHNALSHLGTS